MEDFKVKCRICGRRVETYNANLLKGDGDDVTCVCDGCKQKMMSDVENVLLFIGKYDLEFIAFVEERNKVEGYNA